MVVDQSRNLNGCLKYRRPVSLLANAQLLLLERVGTVRSSRHAYGSNYGEHHDSFRILLIAGRTYLPKHDKVCVNITSRKYRRQVTISTGKLIETLAASSSFLNACSKRIKKAVPTSICEVVL